MIFASVGPRTQSFARQDFAGCKAEAEEPKISELRNKDEILRASLIVNYGEKSKGFFCSVRAQLYSSFTRFGKWSWDGMTTVCTSS